MRKNGIALLVTQLTIHINDLENINDLGLLIDIFKTFPKLSDYIQTDISDEFFLPIDSIANDINVAIDTLDLYGFSIQNKEDIIMKAKNYEFADIQIFLDPQTNTDFMAFTCEPSQSNILLRAAINQFLDRTSEEDFFNKTGEFYNCLTLLDLANQEELRISDDLKIKIFTTLREQLNQSTQTTSECKEILEQKIEKSEARNKIAKFFKDNNDSLPEPIISYLLESELDKEQVDDIIMFFKCNDDTYSLENINRILDMFKGIDISSWEDPHIIGKDRMIVYLMSGTRMATRTDENIELLREIYKKFKTIHGLDEEYLLYQLFDSEDIKSKVISKGEQIWTDIVNMSEEQITSGDIQGSIKSLIDMELNLTEVPKTID